MNEQSGEEQVTNEEHVVTSDHSEESGTFDPEQYKRVTNDMHKFKREAKEYRAKMQEFQSKLEQVDIQKMEESSEHQKLAEHWKNQATQYKSELDNTTQAIVNEKKFSAIEREARKQGIRGDRYLNILTSFDTNDIIVETTSTGRHNVLGADVFVEQVKQEYPDLFTDQAAPSINNSTGEYRVSKTLSGKDLLELKKKDPVAYQKQRQAMLKQQGV